ncbi:MAG: replication initiator protein [Microviridae sp.]|nr:MAG: replication initiator protein [Microviridae sp.]
MAECTSPYIIKDPKKVQLALRDQGASVPVPCGKCPNCRKRYASGWSFRLMQEEKRSINAHFITLTYCSKNVPISNAGYMTLDKTHVQKYMKKVRWNHEQKYGKNILPIRYFAVGEYGGKTNRPHYHLIMYNVDIDLLQPSWEHGGIHYGKVSEASIGYTLKYCMKPGKIPMHARDDRLPEFRLMSQRLGDNYLTPGNIKWHIADVTGRAYCVTADGKKLTMPRYYKDKVYDQVERKRLAHYYATEMTKKTDELIRKNGSDYFRKMREVEKHELQKMWSKAQHGRNKI